jgi:hypothetical protein
MRTSMKKSSSNLRISRRNSIILLNFCSRRFTVGRFTMDVVIQVRNRGVITLPAELREKYGSKMATFSVWSIRWCVRPDPIFTVPELARRSNSLSGSRSEHRRRLQGLRSSGSAMSRRSMELEKPRKRSFHLLHNDGCDVLCRRCSE